MLARARIALIGLSVLGTATEARADVSSWLFAGGGASVVNRSGSTGDVAGSLQLDAGMGSSPAHAVAVGGLVRTRTRFGDGTDLGGYVRTATGGFVRGSWGGALDLGGFGRFWGQTAPGYGGTLSLGAPWGITLGLDAARDTQGLTTFALVLGIDLARMSVYRSTGLSWMPNPFPSPRSEAR
jgi:hypothetical protein